MHDYKKFNIYFNIFNRKTSYSVSIKQRNSKKNFQLINLSFYFCRENKSPIKIVLTLKIFVSAP